ncbi:MAG: AbrB/MazE/SpoVT family DNA-binding domain-containing protein [Spiribacter salinus]|uniref:AbrB/MazE/SpoVT family DNA-binding domain-containing protein n=1 Tax=Spiribacter salinus TaxID=1335746 RepID=A0A540VEY7_9GAMM|nr:MAG: AbrB/MazE/SpoVT family DNA-binding domain-containing protein [Spiribacter salinus]
MHTSTVTKKGQIVIPAPLRRKLGFEQGIQVVVTEAEDGVVVRPLTEDTFARHAGLLKGDGKATQALLDDRTHDRSDEDRRS